MKEKILKKMVMQKMACARLSIKKFETAIETLENIKWIRLNEKISDKILKARTLNLDIKTDLGRIAATVAILENFFPEDIVKVAELYQSKKAESSFKTMEDILEYENQQLIVIINGIQYDPNSLHEVWPQYEGLMEFSPWKAIATSRMIIELEDKNSFKKIRLLNHLKKACPLKLLDYQLVSAYTEVGNLKKAIDVAKKLSETKPQARLYYALYFLTGDNRYKDLLNCVYGTEMFETISHSLKI
jgi:hypothetical protein